jgi:hypothetical protein
MIHGAASYQQAQQLYDQLKCWLSKINQAALESLEEAEMETLTVIRLKTPALLRKTLLSTNPLESLFSNVRSRSGCVKNWRSSTDQASRWASPTLLEAQNKFRLIRGYRELPVLMSALKKFGLAIARPGGVTYMLLPTNSTDSMDKLVRSSFNAARATLALKSLSNRLPLPISASFLGRYFTP